LFKGTIIGTSRSDEFKEKSGRRKAAKKIIKHGIMNLICVGGDGTLIGANFLKEEWSNIIKSLLESC
jgi:6-phosphofructokinase 1